MALSYSRRLRELHRLLPPIYHYSGPGYHYQLATRNINLLAWHLKYFSPPNLPVNFSECLLEKRGCRQVQRFISVSRTSHRPLPDVDLLPFIISALNKHEGPHHCWFNRVEDDKSFYKRDGLFLVVAGVFTENSSISGRNSTIMFEKVKALQQRYPLLQVMGLQTGTSICSRAAPTSLLKIIMKEYITFPVLFCNRDFSEMTDEPCYIIFGSPKRPLVYHEKDVDFVILDKVIKELTMQHSENPRVASNFKRTWVKPMEAVKEPWLLSSFGNSLLYYPGGISVDESGNRIFLSDINHHRIIVFDGSGRILDCIGSSPGFEDGEFEFVKLMRPASSFYHASEDCLYFVDSENHAIRRAHMQRRVVETFYPKLNNSWRSNSFWSWIMDKLWTKRDSNTKSGNLNSESFLFPWHLMSSSNNDLFILNRSFENLWIMDLSSGAIKEVYKGFPKIMEICGQTIMEKLATLNQIPSDLLLQQVDANALVEIPYAGLMSSVAIFQDHIFICDTVGQALLKCSRNSGAISSFHLSDFGRLGLPYWLVSSLERVHAIGNVLAGIETDHVQHFNLLPGRIDIQLNIEIPRDMEFVEPLQDSCVWRQARGAATEVSGSEIKMESSEKVGVAQQWYDELDGLAFSEQQVESSTEEVKTASDEKLQGKACIHCAVDTSPGTSEVVICAAMYLRLKKYPSSCRDENEKKAARIADILSPLKHGKVRRDSCIQYLQATSQDLEKYVFIKPLHVRIKFDCRDHPKADNKKDIILTDSSIEVKVAV